jgi:hypothetical protein
MKGTEHRFCDCVRHLLGVRDKVVHGVLLVYWASHSPDLLPETWAGHRGIG